MADVTLFWCPQCNRCRHLAAPPVDERVRCIGCDVFYPHAGRLFGASDWKTETDPFRMAAALPELGHEPSARKWRLLACAVGRTEYDWCRNPWFRDALDCAEKWADTGEPPRGTEACVTHFASASDRNPRRHHSYGWINDARGWVHIARRMLRADPRLRPDDCGPPPRGLLASLLRELIPNPYSPIEWNPEWCTSTVRDLAQTMYASRDFGGMSILADALQDADCNDKRILNHCRAEKLHVRGCWLLDAILGKT